MSFATVLDAYCSALGCTNKLIAERCDISPSALSRYRSGDRTPEPGSPVIERLACGLSELSSELNQDDRWRENAIRSAFEGSLSGARILGMSFGARINELMVLLGLRNSEVAKAVGISPSYVSRIRSGQRVPSDRGRFANLVAQLAAARCSERDKANELVALIDSASEVATRAYLDLDSLSDLAEVIERWLLGDNIVESDLDAVTQFFEMLNSLYFEDELKNLAKVEPPASVEGAPCELSQFFYGEQRMQEAELAFFATSAAHDATEVYMSSDMPLLEMTLQPDFSERYRKALGGVLRKGAHLTVIHGLERPLSEAVMAMEMWFPLYLTGNVTPYYLKGMSSSLMYHVNYASDVCALSAEAVRGHREEGRYYLTTDKDDVAYYRKKLLHVLDRASSLLEIHRSEDADAWLQKYDASIKEHDRAAKGREVARGRYSNLRIISYPGDCAVVSIMRDPIIHLVIRHPKLRYVIGHMQ